MYRDIAEIRQFYQSPLGRFVVSALDKKIRFFWPDLKTDTRLLAGVGYAFPFLNDAPDSKHIAVMAAGLGAQRWPADDGDATRAGRVVVADDHVLPFAEQSIDRLLLVHAVENADYLRELMAEAWRVLKPNGRMLLVVPSRAGLWSHVDKTPFGHGRPYSMKQMRNLLRAADFVVERHTRALYAPPSHNRLLIRLAPMLDIAGEMLLPKFGGVVLVEASKHLYNVTPILARGGVKPRENWGVEPVPAGFSSKKG